MKICFLLPSNSISGGIFTVFKQASALEGNGHVVTIAFLQDEKDYDKTIYPGMDKVRMVSVSDLCEADIFDVAVATWWETMFWLPDVRARHYLYFVQGFEDEFYEPGNRLASMVPVTYQEDNHYLTISDALSDMLYSQFARSAAVVPCGIDLSLFERSMAAIPNRGRMRAMVEGLPNENRKQVQYTLSVLSSFEELEIVYVSPSGKLEYDARIDYFFQGVPYEQMPALYKSCDFIVKLSTTESFALPVLEMFASGGTAVVTAFKGHGQYIHDRKNALVVPIGDRDAAKAAVQELLLDSSLMSSLRSQARDTADTFGLKQSTDRFELLLNEAVANCSGCGALSRIREARPLYDKYKQRESKV